MFCASSAVRNLASPARKDSANQQAPEAFLAAADAAPTRRPDGSDASSRLNPALTLSRNDAISCGIRAIVQSRHRYTPRGKVGPIRLAICPLDLLFSPSEPSDGIEGCANPPRKQAFQSSVPFREPTEDTIFSDTYRRSIASGSACGATSRCRRCGQERLRN
jgi:hypothetical protein